MVDDDGLKVHEVRLAEDGLGWSGVTGAHWERSLQAMVGRMQAMGPVGTRFLLAFGANSLLDLLVRQAASRLGFVPVTMNWQADTPAVVEYKLKKTAARFVVAHESCPEPIRALIESEIFELPVLDVTESVLLEDTDVGDTAELEHAEPALILFTSGTTGTPKGVELSTLAYQANLNIFRSFLDLAPEQPVRVVLVNPMHHANSSSMSSWAMMYRSAELFLCSHYGTRYWDALAQIADGYEGRIIAPLVARHFEYLENLVNSGRLELTSAHRDALARTEFLVGSAPVGPQTVERFKKLTGRLPKVRFGSTELCLQALGIPPDLREDKVLHAFEKGWSHGYQGEDLTGYYIGCPHEPLTQAKVVRSVVPGDPDFMHPVSPGEPGLLVVKSAAQMSGYVDEPAATESVLHEGWYLGLGDVVFYLTNADTERLDYYWVSRSAGLLIRGGANYSCVQLESELKEFVTGQLGWREDGFDLAVVGHKLGSEHEDSCCVLLELQGVSKEEAEKLAREFKQEAMKSVSKGARPDHVALGKVPRNFKGATVRPEVRKYFDGLE